jgi:RecA-family ATPase
MTAAQIDAVPAELVAADRWLAWRYEERTDKDGRKKLTKVPVRCDNPKRQASSTDPTTWTTFAAALAVAEEDGVDGPGFVLGDGYAGVDLDGCRHPTTGSIHPAAFRVIAKLDSYTEISPSGCGVKVFCRGTLPEGRRAQPDVTWKGYLAGVVPPEDEKYELAMFATAKYFTVTGQHLEFTPADLEERTDKLADLHACVFPPEPATNGARPHDPTPVDLDDGALIERAMAAANGTKFRALWNGDIGGYASHSEADQALCNLLAFWAGADGSRMDALFRQSGLMRDKWQRREGYRKRTIARALASCTETYSGPQAAQPEGQPMPDDDGAEPRVELLFDPADFLFDRFLNREPPPRRWLIEDFLPHSVVGLLAAAGGTGKDFFLYQLGMSIATGLPFLEMDVQEVGGVLYLAAEDDEDELHRRGRLIFDHYSDMGRIIDRAALAERLVVKSRVADNNLLTAGREGEVARTALVDQLIAQARLVPDLKLIALSPVSRFRGGKANSEEDTTRFVEALELVRRETGAGVKASIHVNKASISGGNDEGDQSIVRGSTAIVDGPRWIATMRRLRKDAAKDYGVDPEDAIRYARLELPKANYVRPFPGIWLMREFGGVLVPASLRTPKEAREARTEARVDREYEEVLEKVIELLRREGPMTGRHMEDRWAGKNGVLGVGQKTLRGVLDRALEKGDLRHGTEIGPGGGRLLEVPE